MKPPLRLALIWHFHQPDYTDPVSGAPSMPWTRLHALKDYVDMTEHVLRHPKARLTFNVVPSLIDQLRALASPDAKPDRFLELAVKPAEELDADERRFVVAHFFSLNRDTMIRPLKRFDELAALRGDAPAAELAAKVVERFDTQALRDLQLLFHLAWSGATLRAEPLLTRLTAKGRGFDEDDKAALFARQRTFAGSVLDRWRAAAASEQIEFSVTPYYHPILPLLCDVESAREALPGLALPGAAFRHPEDAELQLLKGMEAFQGAFGRRAAGGWPSEGAISEEALRRMGAVGYGWAGSDEDVLFASLGESLPADRDAMERRRAELLYRPWRHAQGPVLLFRDHDLSDRIGFTYQSRAPEDAAHDFVGRLLQLRELASGGQESPVVSVILDGENAWEHFPDHGAPFFDAFYGALAAEPAIEMVTASSAADPAHATVLPRVVAGSWIYRNLATWVGHPEKNRAWELLAAARDAVAEARGALSWDDPAWRAILAAEGSDWFWWFGDDHPTAYAAEFDAAFRGKLRAAYVAANRPVPGRLAEPVRRAPARGHTPPAGRVRAHLDGRVTDFFEWQAAGRVEAIYGAMQSSARLVRQIYFGSDGASLFVRIDPFETGSLEETDVRVQIAERADLDLVARAGAIAGPVTTVLDRVLELAIPLAALAPMDGPLRFAIVVERGDGAHQRVPAGGFAELPPADADPARFDWAV